MTAEPGAETPKLDWRNYYEWESAQKRFLPGEESSEHLRVDFVFRLLGAIAFERVLDAGCGNGYLAALLAEKARDRTLATDLSLGRLRDGRALFPRVRFTRASLFDQPFADRSFDLVTAVEVIEHLESPEAALRELKRLSSRYVLITVPYRGKLELLRCPHCSASFHLDGHIQSFDEERMSQLVHAAGLRVLRLEAYVPYYPPTRMPVRLLPRPVHRALRRVFEALRLARPTPPKFLGVLAERTD